MCQYYSLPSVPQSDGFVTYISASTISKATRYGHGILCHAVCLKKFWVFVFVFTSWHKYLISSYPVSHDAQSNSLEQWRHWARLLAASSLAESGTVRVSSVLSWSWWSNVLVLQATSALSTSPACSKCFISTRYTHDFLLTIAFFLFYQFFWFWCLVLSIFSELCKL